MQPFVFNSAPLIIGGTGGSGTRAVAQLLIKSGQIYLGKNHNKALDCLDFKSFYDTHIPNFLPHFYHQETLADNPLFNKAALETDLAHCLHNYNRQRLEDNAPDSSSVWGWKGPRSMFLLPFFHFFFPKLKFLHVIRDGRDMAYSTNQNQLRLYGKQSIPITEKNHSQAECSIALWERANLTASEYANTHMANQYRCVKYEDLVFQTDKTIANIADFLDIASNDLLQHQTGIAPSPNCGRWQTQCKQELESVVKRGARGLYYFGYS